jgi:hypothetical protein
VFLHLGSNINLNQASENLKNYGRNLQLAYLFCFSPV